MRPRLGPREALASGDSRSAAVPYSSRPTAVLTPNLIRYHERVARNGRGSEWSWAVVLLVIAAITYNGFLAILNANFVVSIQRYHVVLSEIFLLSGAGALILGSGSRPGDGPPVAFFAFFVLDALIVSMLNNAVFVDMARNAAIITLFMMLGARLDTARLNRCFTVAAIIVAAVLLLEMVSTPTYAAWFAPGDYFAQTRGIPKEQFDELGLFGNALGFDTRFAILNVMDHRACSIFLEQVSLANFAIVLMILLACNWEELSLSARGIFSGLIILILITTNSRLALALMLMAPVACLLALWWNRFLALLVMPSILLMAALLNMDAPASRSDDLQGRLSKTIDALANLDMAAIGGFKALKVPAFADSGYAYVIYASTILGMLALWLFVSLIVSGNKPKLLRCSLLVNLYVFCSLMVSGNSVFSIKTAALLWLLVGKLRAEAVAEEAKATGGPHLPSWPRRAAIS